jgi:hypothetical protein
MTVAAQEQELDTVGSLSGIEIVTAVDRADMYIGDLITYTVTITYDSSYQLIPPPLGANLGAFDVKDYKTDIISRLDDGRMQSANEFILSTFTTGDYVIPQLPVVFELPDGSRKLLLSEAVPIKVNSLITNLGDSADIRPSKPPLAVKEIIPEGPVTSYVLLIVGLAALGVFLLWFFVFRKREAEAPDEIREPWEVAFAKLADLQQSSLLMQEQYKQFYFELTEIIREYLGRMYQQNVLDMTTEEFLDTFKEISLPSDSFDTLKPFFNHADLVKFAKMTPESARPQSDVELVHQTIEIVRVDYQRKLERQKQEEGTAA